MSLRCFLADPFMACLGRCIIVAILLPDFFFVGVHTASALNFLIISSVNVCICNIFSSVPNILLVYVDLNVLFSHSGHVLGFRCI